jgi:hypothetical protein
VADLDFSSRPTTLRRGQLSLLLHHEAADPLLGSHAVIASAAALGHGAYIVDEQMGANALANDWLSRRGGLLTLACAPRTSSAAQRLRPALGVCQLVDRHPGDALQCPWVKPLVCGVDLRGQRRRCQHPIRGDPT